MEFLEQQMSSYSSVNILSAYFKIKSRKWELFLIIINSVISSASLIICLWFGFTSLDVQRAVKGGTYMWTSSCLQDIQIRISRSSAVDFSRSPEILSVSRGFVASPFLPRALLHPLSASRPPPPCFKFLPSWSGLCCLLQLTERHQRTVGAVWSVPVTTAVCVAPSDSSCSCRGRGYRTTGRVSTPAPLDTTDREGRMSTAAWVRFTCRERQSVLTLSLTHISTHESFALRLKLE